MILKINTYTVHVHLSILLATLSKSYQDLPDYRIKVILNFRKFHTRTKTLTCAICGSEWRDFVDSVCLNVCVSEERLCCGVPAIHYRGLRTADHVTTVTGKHQQGQWMELQDTDVYCSMSLNPLVLRELQICSKFIHNRTGNNTKYMYQDIFVIFIFNHFFLTDIGSYLTIPSKGRIIYMLSLFGLYV